MKTNKLVIATVAACLAGSGMHAQTIYEANRLIGSDLNGTARFVGMGGAMGALGGDISTIATNPAGIGLFRSNDVVLSFGFNNAATQSKFGSVEKNASQTRASFDNAGFVYSNRIGNQTALKFVNFGFNFHKKSNFNKSLAMSGDLNGLSQTGQMATMTNGLTSKQADNIWSGNPSEVYNNWDYGWLSVLGIRGNLVSNEPVLGPDGQQETDANGNPLVYDDLYVGTPGRNGTYQGKTTGGINQYDFNVSFNFKDQVYLGFTLGAYDVSYNQHSFYSENVEGGSYSLENWFSTDGAGIDFKVGAIIRPVLSSSFRFGVAVHTPTWYNLTDTHSARLNSAMQIGDKIYNATEDTYTAVGNAVREYQLVTPWKFDFSLGYTIGSSVALGAEYEYADHSTAKLKDVDGYAIEDENSRIANNLKAVHTARFGVEAKLIPEFSVRAGYNFSSASFVKGAYKALPVNSTRTDTEYENSRCMNNITLGMGYRGHSIYADLAYQYSMYKSDFYPFDNTDLQATKVDNNRHQLLLTLGVRF